MSLFLTLNIFHNFFYCFYCWLGRPHCIRLEQISNGKRPKYFEASCFPCSILNNTYFWNRSRKSKNFMMLVKLVTSANKMVYSGGSFLWWGLFVPKFKPIACVIDKQRDVCRSTFCYRNYVCEVWKLQHMYVIGSILLSALENTKQTRLYQI